MYLKSNHPKVIEAAQTYLANLTKFKQDSIKFQELMEADAAISYKQAGDIIFAGLTFKPNKDRKTWTVPDKHSGTQRPRPKVSGLTKEGVVEHLELLKKWNTNIPKDRVSPDAFYETLGTHRGQMYFQRMSWFLHEGFVYIDTDAKLSDSLTEILGSEYQSAKEARNE